MRARGRSRGARLALVSVTHVTHVTHTFIHMAHLRYTHSCGPVSLVRSLVSRLHNAKQTRHTTKRPTFALASAIVPARTEFAPPALRAHTPATHALPVRAHGPDDARVAPIGLGGRAAEQEVPLVLAERRDTADERGRLRRQRRSRAYRTCVS